MLSEGRLPSRMLQGAHNCLKELKNVLAMAEGPNIEAGFLAEKLFGLGGC